MQRSPGEGQALPRSTRQLRCVLMTSAWICGHNFVPFPGTQLCRIRPLGQGAAKLQLPTVLPKPGDKKASLEALQKKYCSSACCLLSLLASQQPLQGLKGKRTWESNNPAEGSGLQNHFLIPMRKSSRVLGVGHSFMGQGAPK